MIFTFYSYKGGVGRSMALANVASWLREQRLRVAMVDWDLEAPGLESFFFESKPKLEEFASQVGVIDLLLGYKRLFPRLQKKLEEQRSLEEKIAFLDESLPPITSALCRVDDRPSSSSTQQPLLLTAGLRAGSQFSSYAHNVQGFDWNGFYNSFQGLTYFEWMRAQLLRQADVVFIDSRTGLNEMSGVCAQQLADVIVSFCAPNLQNLNGVVSMTESFSREELIRDRGGRRVEVVLVPTRIDNFNPTRINQFEEQFAALTEAFTPQILKVLKTPFWKLALPYAPAHSSREEVIVGRRDADKHLETAYQQLAAYLAMFAKPQSELRRKMTSEIDRLIGRVLPTVFVLQSPDTETFAEELRRRISEANVSVWPQPEHSASQDPRAGVNSLLEQTRVMVVPVSAAALQSPDSRDAWRRARQLGVTVIAVWNEPLEPQALAAIPGWMRTAPFLDVERDWGRILDALNSITPGRRIPQMAPDVPAQSIPRPRELKALKDILLSDHSTRVALYGAPGSGKTALARAFAADDEVQSFFPDGILWMSLCSDNNIHDEFAKVQLALTGDPLPAWSGSESFSAVQSRLKDTRCLFVLDELESVSRIRELPWIPTCRYLITTSDRRIASAAEATPIEVGALDREEARAILAQSGTIPEDKVDDVIEAVGALPSALRIASAAAAAAGPAIPVARIVSEVDATLTVPFAAVLAKLEEGDRNRAADLAFGGDGPLEMDAVCRLWHVDAGEGLKTLTRMGDLGLVSFAADQRSVTMHPYVRRVIAATMPERDLNHVLDARFAKIPPADAVRAQRVLCRLVRLNELSDPEPRTILASDLPGEQLDVLDELEGVEIVVRVRDAAQDTIALSNPAACRQWRQLRQWVEADRVFLSWRQRLGAYVSNWQRTRDAGALLSGTLLAEGVKWQASREAELSAEENRYIAESRRFAASASAPAARPGGRQSVLQLVTAAALVLTVVGVGYCRLSRPPATGSLTSTSVGPDPDVAKGDAFAGAGDLVQAIAAYTAALTRRPNDADVYVKRGSLRTATGNRDLAMTDFTKAIEIAPSMALAYLGRADLYETAGRTSDAVTDLQQVVKRSEDPLSVRTAQARLEKLGASAPVEAVATVTLQYRTENDRTLAESVARYLSSRGQRVVAVQQNPSAPNSYTGELRFLAKDRAVALRVKEIVQGGLADQGIRLELKTTPVEAAAGAVAGRIEVSLPTLASKQ